MTHLSPAAVLAWKIGMFEALLAGSRYLEPEHLFIGLCSLEKVLSPDDLARDVPAARSVLHEKDVIDLSLTKTRTDAGTARHRVRKRLPRNERQNKPGVIHRSRECRSVFDRAEAMADKKEVSCSHLLDAILEDPGPVILSVLAPSVSPGVRAAHPPAVVRMSDAIQKFRNSDEQKMNLQATITTSRHTLASLPPGSERSARLKQQIHKKTIRVGMLCLVLGDIPGLVASLQELADAGSRHRDEMIILCSQLEYIHAEGIPLCGQSRELIRAVLDQCELSSGTGGAE